MHAPTLPPYTIPAPHAPSDPYPIPEPETPISIYILSLILVIGLIALFIAAYFAFQQTQTPIQAFFSALLIEAGAIGESFALVRRKNALAVIGLLISVIVSGTYNYVQAQTIGNQNALTDQWQLLTLALGPLAALIFLALSTGFELAAHETALADWETKRQNFTQAQTHAHQEKLTHWETSRQNFYNDAHAKQQQIEEKNLRYQLKQDRKLSENLPILPETNPGNLPTNPPHLNGNGNGKTPVPTPIYTHWKQIPESDYMKLSEMTTAQIFKTYRLKNMKTAYNWQRNALAALAQEPNV